MLLMCVWWTWKFQELISKIEWLKLNNKVAYVQMRLNKQNKKTENVIELENYF